MDLRDAGESEPEMEYYSLKELAADALALLDALAIDRVHVVGYSLGGVVAQQMVLDHPDRINRLVVISSFAYSIRGHRPDVPMPPPEDW